MATDSAKYPRLRKTFASMLLFGLVALFFAFNYLVYIPHQQNMYNEKVFRVIHEMAEEIMSRTKANQEYLSRSYGPDTLKREDYFTVSSRDTFVSELKDGLNNSFKKYNPGKKESPVRVCDFRFTTDSIKFSPAAYNYPPLLLKDIFDDIERLHPDFFLHLMLADTDSTFKDKHSLLYKTRSLAVEGKINGDSLLKTNNSFQFATLRNMNIEGQDYKLFLLPFNFGKQELLLGGFMTEDAYKANASGYSPYTFLFIGILMALIIISLPVIKIFMLGRQENITIMDVRMLMVSLVLAPVFVLLIAASSWINNVADSITDTLLNAVDSSVKDNFYKEISNSVNQLRQYDSNYANPGSTSVFNNLKQYYSDKIPAERYKANQNFKDSLFYPVIYKNMDNVFWINKAGQQIAKWYLLKKSSSYINLSERQYFKEGLANRFYTLPFDYSKNKLKQDSFLIEPTISWSTGQYNINLVIKSNQHFENDSAVIVGMSGNFYSVCNPITPKGLNFCIVNDEGNILIHSQTYRSLHENIFEESNNNRKIKSAVFNKSNLIIADINLYGNDVKMKISPLKGMPFYLVTYLDKRDQRFFTSHIIRFTFFVTCMQLLMLLIYLVYYYFVSLKKSDLYFNSGDSSWMKPSSKRVDIYTHIFLIEILILVLLIMILPLLNAEQRYPFMLQAIMMLPFYITTGYYIVRKTHSCLPVKKLILWYYFFVVILYAFIKILFNYYDDASIAYAKNLESNRFTSIPIILFSVMLPWIVLFCIKIQQRKQFLKKVNFLDKYIMAIFSTIILFSVVPFAGFISYAFHEELTMQTKARQYDIAQQIDKRRTFINNSADSMKFSFANDTAYMRERKFSSEYGIYLPRNIIQPVNDTAHYNFYDNENLYKLVTNFLMLPVDHVDFFDNNNYYNWKQDKASKKLSLIYKNDRDIVTPDYIKIDSSPKYSIAFSMIFTKTSGWLMLMIITLFFIIQYRLIRSLTKKIFLLDYFNEEDTDGHLSVPEAAEKKRALEWLNKQLKIITLTETDELIFGKKGTLTYDVIIAKERLCASGTSAGAECIMLIQQILSPCYKNIWRSCNDDEKFILYDFAVDGFTNYKNADILYSLFLKGLVIKKENQLLIMTKSFRNFLIAKGGSGEIKRLKQDLNIGGSWNTVKYILFFLLFATILFLFVTQREVSKELITVISGLLTLVPLLLKLFDKSPAPSQGKS